MLKNKGSNGHDGIKNKIIKLSLPVTSLKICSLFNQCINSGYFLHGLKVANGMPFFKSGLKNIWKIIDLFVYSNHKHKSFMKNSLDFS